jgi:hypothetical protein
MEQTCYFIEKSQDQWVVSACGTKIMTCKTRRIALRTVRRATVLLHGQQAETFGEETICRQDEVDRAPSALALFYTLPACWFASMAMASLSAGLGGVRLPDPPKDNPGLAARVIRRDGSSSGGTGACHPAIACL